MTITICYTKASEQGSDDEKCEIHSVDPGDDLEVQEKIMLCE